MRKRWGSGVDDDRCGFRDQGAVANAAHRARPFAVRDARRVARRHPLRCHRGLARLASLLLAGSALLVGCGGTPQPTGVPPEQVADFLYTVIAADRAVYADQVVHRLQNVEGVIVSDEKFEEKRALPLPSQMLRMASKRAAERSPFRYALISQWAINKANMPRTPFETAGLAAVAKDPSQPHRSHETVQGRRYFMALYPDVAVSAACVSCHNEHPESPRRDFAVNDVMGGVVISIPLETQ